MTASSRTLLALLCLGLYLQRATAVCYNPDGSTSNNTPCSDDGDESTCCGAGWTCYGTSAQFYLCRQKTNTGYYYKRGTCTDQSWRSSSCPGICVEVNRDNRHGAHEVGQCPDSDTNYYCVSPGLGEDNCTTNFSLFSFMIEPTVLTTIGIVEPTTSSSISSPTSSSLSTITASPVSNSITKSTTTTSPAVTVTTIIHDDNDISKKTAIGVGAGVGVGVGALVFIAALAFQFIRRRKQKRANAKAATSAAGYAADSGNMDNAPAGYAPTPNLGSPSHNTSPYPSELYDSHSPAPMAAQPHISEMPNTQPATNYVMA